MRMAAGKATASRGLRLRHRLGAHLPSAGGLVSALLLALLAVAMILFAAAVARLLAGAADNRLIRSLLEGREVAVEGEAAPEVLAARAYVLMTRERFEEAQELVERVAGAGEGRLPRAALYDLANARLRAALAAIEANRIDEAASQVRLAKDLYRRALALDPGFWDAKYNLDVAMRLVRDFPQIEQLSEDEPPETEKPLWTDLPGLPKGLP